MNIFSILLTTHIAGGTAALLAGTIAAFAEKGGKVHKKGGVAFALSMLIVAVSALVMSTMHPSPFLFSIGVFTLYLISSGWLWVWKLPMARKLAVGRALGYAGLATAAYMFWVAFATSELINIVLLAFGSILSILSGSDAFRRQRPKSNIALHGGRMGGAFIAAVTAFAVVNAPAFGMAAWLVPTAIGSPLIALSLAKWNRKIISKKVQS